MQTRYLNIEKTDGYRVAMSFKPFIDPRCSEHMEIVKDMAAAINSLSNKVEPNELLITRAKQFLSSLDYSTFTEFQAKCALLLEQQLQTQS